MIRTWEFFSGNPGSFVGRTKYVFAFQFWHSRLSVQNQWRRNRRLNLIIFVVWSALIVCGWWWLCKTELSFTRTHVGWVLGPSFNFWCLSRKWEGVVNAIFSCVTTEIENILLRSSASDVWGCNWIRPGSPVKFQKKVL